MNTTLVLYLLLPFIALAQDCTEFVPESCIFGDAVPLVTATCKPKSCGFNRNECGFPATGKYKPSLSCSKDPFMYTTRKGATACGSRCCAADISGKFKTDGKLPTGSIRYTYQPATGQCTYTDMTRGQVMHALEQINAPLVVFGDSIMRQVFLRLVMMMRGQQTLLDYKVHTLAQYMTCDEADAFRLSINSPIPKAPELDLPFLREQISPFFNMKSGPALNVAKESLKRCSKKPVQLHYVFAQSFANQAASIPIYTKTVTPKTKPIVVAAVGFWEKATEVPANYLAALAGLKKKASKVFIVSVPTGYELPGPRRDAYIKRNAFMKSWVKKQGAPFYFADLDALSTASSPKPPSPLGKDKHWMCAIGWHPFAKPQPYINNDPNSSIQIPEGALERIQVTSDGLCADETDRNLWQMMLNVIVKP